jgi:hypothetical protein
MIKVMLYVQHVLKNVHFVMTMKIVLNVLHQEKTTQHVIAQMACGKMQMEFVKIVIQNVKHAKIQLMIVQLVKKTEPMLTQVNVYAQLELTMMEISPVQHVLIDVQLVILVQ